MSLISARVAVLSGDNGYFCAGYDLRHAKDLNVRIERGEYEFDPNDAYPKGPMGPTRLQLKKPIIAAIAGPAVAGGMELALWANIRVMEKITLLLKVMSKVYGTKVRNLSKI